jgi:hypothetical protein
MPAPNRNLRTHNAYTLGSPPPTLSCPYCSRHFHSKGGRAQHIRAKHHIGGHEPHGSDPSLPPSPVPSALHSSPPELDYEQALSPIPFKSTTPPSCEDVNPVNPDIDVDVEQPFNLNSTQPDFYGDQLNEDLPPGRDATEQRPDPPHPPHLMRSYHPKIDGELSAFKSIPTLMMIIFRENL